MKKNQKLISVSAMISFFTVTTLLLPRLSDAGDNKHDQMMTMLDDIYDIVSDTNSKVIPTKELVPKTGQTVCYGYGYVMDDCTGTGQDGEYQMGVAWPVPRFTDNADGTVTDNMTRLMWVKNGAILPESKYDWEGALTFCQELNLLDYNDWRMPNIKEMLSLIDYGMNNPALPDGHPFENIYIHRYWTSTSDSEQPIYAFAVYIRYGLVWQDDKTNKSLLVLPVRGGT